MTEKIAIFLNHLFSDGVTGLGAGLMLWASILGLLWTFAEAAGARGSLITFIVLSLTSVLPVAALRLRSVRWAVVPLVLRSNIRRVAKLTPEVIIGIGPGGAIVSGIIAKLLLDRTGAEPRVYVIDRTFKWEGKVLEVALSVALSGEGSSSSNVEGKQVLLATSEVHTGRTMKKASEHLDGLRVDHKTFTLICSPSTGFDLDYFVIRSDKRGLLPWRDAPEREPEGER